MSVSTFQKITFLSCLALCVTLFLPKVLFPRGKKDIVQSKVKVGPGYAPPLANHPSSVEQAQRQAEVRYTRPYHLEVISRLKDADKPHLLGQVIPVYGFGIFLYIIYIFFKVCLSVPSSRTKTHHPSGKSVQAPSQHKKQRKQHLPAREMKMPTQKEITRVILEGRSPESFSPEMEAEETPYTSDWQGYSEETFPHVSFHGHRRCPSIILEEPDMDVPTAEELAERMERGEEEEDEDEDEEEEGDHNDDDDDDEEGEEPCDPEDAEEEEGDHNDDDDDDDDEEGEEPCDPEDAEEEVETDLETEQELEEEHGAETVKVEEEGDEEDDEDEEDDDQQADVEQEEEESEEEEASQDLLCPPHNSVGGEKEAQSPVGRKERKQITFSDHRHVFLYTTAGLVGCEYVQECGNKNDIEDVKDDEEDEEDLEEEDLEDEEEKQDEEQKEVQGRGEEDPLMVAESLGFSTEDEWDPEEQEVDLVDFLLTYQPDTSASCNQPTPARPEGPSSGTLRMRHKKQTKQN